MMIASSGCWWGNIHVGFIVDTNGTKGPNKFGYDVFYYQINSENKLLPSAGNYFLWSTSEITNSDCCNFKESTCVVERDTGVSCGLYAVRNVSPHDPSKKYWESLP